MSTPSSRVSLATPRYARTVALAGRWPAHLFLSAPRHNPHRLSLCPCAVPRAVRPIDYIDGPPLVSCYWRSACASRSVARTATTHPRSSGAMPFDLSLFHPRRSSSSAAPPDSRADSIRFVPPTPPRFLYVSFSLAFWLFCDKYPPRDARIARADLTRRAHRRRPSPPLHRPQKPRNKTLK